MNNQYWVYVNEPNNKALVHLSSCSHCNDGQGRDEGASRYNGEWFGPFDKDEAEARALRLGKKTKRWCGHCAKHIGVQPELGGGEK